jgi:hypothetical protein
MAKPHNDGLAERLTIRYRGDQDYAVNDVTECSIVRGSYTEPRLTGMKTKLNQ